MAEPTAVLDHAETVETEGAAATSPELQAPLLDLLVEDVSIDGMCGVY